MAKQKRAKKKPVANDNVIGPTPEQLARSPFALDDVLDRDGAGARKIGKAYRRVRMVEVLHKRSVLTNDEAKALLHYRHHADMTDRSPVRNSLNQSRGGSGCGPTIGILNAAHIVGQCEAAAGSLSTLLRGIVVDDDPTEYWASRRRCRRAVIEFDLRMAARRVMAELAA